MMCFVLGQFVIDIIISNLFNENITGYDKNGNI